MEMSVCYRPDSWLPPRAKFSAEPIVVAYFVADLGTSWTLSMRTPDSLSIRCCFAPSFCGQEIRSLFVLHDQIKTYSKLTYTSSINDYFVGIS